MTGKSISMSELVETPASNLSAIKISLIAGYLLTINNPKVVARQIQYDINK